MVASIQFLASLLCLLVLTGCALPKNRSTVMHGKVRGGDVPLYMLGGLGDFMNAGLVVPSMRGGYLRTEYEVWDMGLNGKLTPAMTTEMNPAAQLAIPLLVSSYKLPGGYEAKYALAPYDELGAQSSLAGGAVVNAPKALPPEACDDDFECHIVE